MVEVASLTVGREFLEDQDNVVSATRICLGGASANGVKRSDGELTEKVVQWESGAERIWKLAPLGRLSLEPHL